MTYKFKDLVDIRKLQELTDDLYAATSIPSSIIAADGEILTGSGWQRICTDFHRRNPQTEKQCIESDTAIREELNKGEPFVIYKCPRGLVDASVPIVIGGEHVANVFSGQVFLAPPDEAVEQFFRQQARAFGFDQTAYLNAFREVPVFTKEKFRAGISFLAKFAHLVADLGMNRLNELKAVEALRKSEATFRRRVENLNDVIYALDCKGRITYISPTVSSIYGSPVESFAGRHFSEFVHPDDLERVAQAFQNVLAHKLNPSEYRLRAGDQTYRWVRTSSRPLYEDGRVVGIQGVLTDISDQKRAEDQLRAGKAKLRAMFNAIPMAIVMIDQQGRIIDSNDEHAARLKTTRGRLLGRIVWDLLPESVRAHRKQQVESVFETGMPFRGQDQRQGVWNAYYIYPAVTNEKAEVRSVIVAALDITESKRAETDLRESEEKFRALVECGPMSILLIRDGVYIYGNPASARLLGYERPEEIVGVAALETIAPEFQEPFRQRLKRIENGRGNPPVEVRLIKPDGEAVWTLSTSVSVRMDGKPTAIVMGQDITALKHARAALQESEAALSTMMENLPAGIMLIDAAGCTIERVNRHTANLFGAPKERILGNNCHNFICPTPEGQCPVCDLGQKIENAEREIIRHDGSRLAVLKSVTPITLNGRKKLLECFVDISKQKALEARLQQAQRLESIGTLAGGIAHDFNNLLFPIVGMAEMLMEDLPPDSLPYENAAEILNAGKKGSDLVKQILAFSRRSEHQKLPVRLQTVLKDVLRLSRATIPADVDISQAISPDCGMVLADPTQLHQVVINLITNAYHAVMPTGGGISVRLAETVLAPHDLEGMSLEPGPYAEVTVADEGHGMTAAILDRIFEPYFTTKEPSKGTGLGLAVVYGIVTKHGGDVSVRSAPGKGTTFQVYLPLLDKASDGSSIEQMDAAASGTERILLVDDEDAVVRLVKQMLERLGYQVSAFNSSTTALDAFAADPDGFDLVLSDMTMPVMTGDQLAREVIAARPEIPVILYTGFSERIDQKKAAALGIKGFLMKPVGRADLAATVRAALDEAHKKESR